MPKWLIPALGGGGALIALGALLFSNRSKSAGWLPAAIVGSGKRRTEQTWSQAPPRPGRVLLIGDSIGAHGGFVRVLEQNLPQHSFENRAVVGHSTGRMLTVAENHIRPGAFSEIIIEGDLNDGNRSSNWTKSNLRRLYQMARASGARVVAVTSTPWHGYRNWSQAAQDRQDEVRRWIMAGADGLIDTAVDAYNPLEDPEREQYLNPRFAYHDDLHLNSAGQQALGEAILEQAYR